MDGFDVMGSSLEQNYSLLKLFKPYLVLENDRLSTSLCGIEGWTLYECIMFWINFKKWNNIIINLKETNMEKVKEIKRQKFLQKRQPMHNDDISEFMLDQHIIYYNGKWYISFQKNGYYKTFTNVKEMLSKLNYSREVIIDPTNIDNWFKTHKERLKNHFEVETLPVENCMVFGDGQKLFCDYR